MKRFQRGHDVEGVLSAIEDMGAVIVTEFLPDSALAQLRGAIKARAEAVEAGAEDGINFWKKFHGAKTKRFTGIGLTSEVFLIFWTMIIWPVLLTVSLETLVINTG